MAIAAGIIAEYNPFHRGHQYHIEETKRRTNAKYIVVAMSGDFVQRGEPALFSKALRARMALLSGADLVLELPAPLPQEAPRTLPLERIPAGRLRLRFLPVLRQRKRRFGGAYGSARILAEEPPSFPAC